MSNLDLFGEYKKTLHIRDYLRMNECIAVWNSQPRPSLPFTITNEYFRDLSSFVEAEYYSYIAERWILGRYAEFDKMADRYCGMQSNINILRYLNYEVTQFRDKMIDAGSSIRSWVFAFLPQMEEGLYKIDKMERLLSAKPDEHRHTIVQFLVSLAITTNAIVGYANILALHPSILPAIGITDRTVDDIVSFLNKTTLKDVDLNKVYVGRTPENDTTKDESDKEKEKAVRITAIRRFVDNVCMNERSTKAWKLMLENDDIVTDLTTYKGGVNVQLNFNLRLTLPIIGYLHYKGIITREEFVGLSDIANHLKNIVDHSSMSNYLSNKIDDVFPKKTAEAIKSIVQNVGRE